MARVALHLSKITAFADGRAFGGAGAYEALHGEARFGFDPLHPANGAITDLELAPRDSAGLVHASADVRILRPVQPERGNRGIFLDVVNRGNSIFERMTEPGPLGPTTRVTDGWLLRRGYAVVSCGWQHDVPRGGQLFGLSAPEAVIDAGAARTPVTGIGILALRDLAAYLRFAWDREFDFVLAMGASQTGRLLRQLVHLGSAADENGRLVIDGVLAIAGGSRMTEANLRFGRPGEQGSASPDAQPGVHTTEHRPRIIELNTSSEYCSSSAIEHVSAALAHVSADAAADAPLASYMRWYLMASTQHAPAPLPLAAVPNATYYPNTVDYKPFVRAAIDNLRAWVCDAVEPPPSCYPRFDAGTLVERDGCLQSAVDADGNELAGIRHPDVSVPLATYTGWNPGPDGKRIRATGATIPFPRSAIEARYVSRESFLGHVRQAAQTLVEQRYLLAEDVDGIVAASGARWGQFSLLEAAIPGIYAEV